MSKGLSYISDTYPNPYPPVTVPPPIVILKEGSAASGNLEMLMLFLCC